jgi:polyketide synthase PksN
MENIADGKLDKQLAAQMIKLLKKDHVWQRQDIAIIGMASSFPGSESSDSFWEVLENGVDCIKEFPASRRSDADQMTFHLNGKPAQGYISGAFLERIDHFDCSFFKLSPKEASLMDPNQRLFLQTAYHAIEDAGYGGGKLAGSKTGIYVGHSSDFGENYKDIIKAMVPSEVGLSVPGNIKSVIASRLAHILDLHGPSMLVDTACSSTLVAVHEACAAIRRGECDMAVTGGGRVHLLPLQTSGDGWVGVASKEGRARTFDDASDGTGLGEGIAAIILKPLHKALKDKDRIHAVIKGSAVNQDGSTIGLTAPNSEAQKKVLLKAWEEAGINPESLSYLEAHGTATKLGDPIEMDGIEAAFRESTDKRQFCAIGSVKTNLGHLDHAAGMASLFKVILAMQNRKLPPTLHFNKPNRKVNFEDSPVYINDKLREWESNGKPRRAGISSFGLSGTNCHLVIEEAVPIDQTISKDEEPSWKLLTLSAIDEDSLLAYARRYMDYLQNNPMISLGELCFTVATGRSHHSHRLAFLFRGREELLRKLDQLTQSGLSARLNHGIYYSEHRIVISNKDKRRDFDLSMEEHRMLSREAAVSIREIKCSDEENKAEGLDKLCRLYIAGGEIDWQGYYEGFDFAKISAPVYPFRPKRCWIEPHFEDAASDSSADMGTLPNFHPLLHQLSFQSSAVYAYKTSLHTDRHWVLSDHRVGEICFPPGTAYLEMVRAASKKELGDIELEFSDVIFLAPLAVKLGEGKKIQTVITKVDGTYSFVIESSDSPGQAVHAQGNFRAFSAPPQPHRFDIQMLRKQFSASDNTNNTSHSTWETPIKFGPRWDNVKELHTSEEGILSFIELDSRFESDLSDYYIHPALLDNAVNLAIRSMGNDFYLPFSYKKFIVHRPMPKRFYSLIRPKGTLESGREAASFDISLITEEGELFAEAAGYTIKKVPDNDRSFLSGHSGETIYYEKKWVQVQDSVSEPLAGTTVVLDQGSPIVKQIKERLRAENIPLIEVGIGKGYEELSDHAFLIDNSEEAYLKLLGKLKNREITRIIHGFNALEGNDDTLAGLEKDLDFGVRSLHFLTKAIVSNKYKRIELILLTAASEEVSGREPEIFPQYAALAGFGKVVRQEYNSIHVTCVDIDSATSVQEILDEIGRTDKKSYKTAMRDGVRYDERIKAVSVNQFPETDFTIKAGGTYVITGGTGGLGIAIARHFAAANKVNLCLISRSGIQNERMASIRATIADIEGTGSIVRCYQTDVASESDMEDTFKQIRIQFGNIDGVIHAAGIAGDGFIIRRDEAAVHQVFSPKIHGAWLLGKCLEGTGPDFVVLFSSINSLVGGQGQGDYTAANAYLDAYVSRLNRRGIRTIAMNWAAWGEVGMAVNYGAHQERGLFKPLATQTALEAFDEVMSRELKSIIIGELDYDVAKSMMGTLPLGFTDDLHHKLMGKGEYLQTGRNDIQNLAAEVKGTSDEVELRVGQIWCGVLGLDEIDIYDHFNQLGGDSIIATYVLKELDKVYPGVVDISDMFVYTTVKDLAAYINSKIKKGEEQVLPTIEETMIRLANGEITIEEASRLTKGQLVI